MFKLEISTPLEDFLDSRNIHSFNRKAIKSILKFFQKIFGTEFLVKIPEGIEKFDLEILPAIDAGNWLKEEGIISQATKSKDYPDEPFIYRYIIGSKIKAVGSGSDFFKESSALWKAVAETSERYSWSNSEKIFSNNTRNSHKKLKCRLNIFKLAGFSDEQKRNNQILQFDNSTNFGWIKAYSLFSKKNILCPAQLISALYFKQNVMEKKTEPMLRWAVSTGLATGRTLEEAITKGLLEIIERDAFMISYLNKLSPPIADLDYLATQDKQIAKIVRDFKRYQLELYVIQMPTDFPVYANLALIIDKTGKGPALTVGASAHFNFKNSFLSAVSEALSVRYSLKNKYDKPVDTKKTNREERLIYWTKKENLSKIDFYLKGKLSRIELNQNFYKNQNYTKEYYIKKLKNLTNKLKNKGYGGCYVELTEKNIKKIGLRSVSVVVPELQPMHLDESIPCLGSKRLRDVPLKLGYQPLEELNKEPHPFP